MLSGLAAEFADAMLRRGIYVIGFSYPVVPKGEARIRVQLSAAHTTEQVNRVRRSVRLCLCLCLCLPPLEPMGLAPQAES